LFQIATCREQPAIPPPQSEAAPSGWVAAARGTARVFSLLLLAFYGFFILSEGLPPIASQPGGVQLNFIALGLMLAGFAVGWKREGAAALLIASGWTLWHIAEGRLEWNLFQTPLPVAALYAFCWWANRGRRTGVVLGNVALLAIAFGFGRLFCPTSVSVRGTVADARTGQAVPNVELRLVSPRGHSNRADIPMGRSDAKGNYRLYVGWYTAVQPLEISAPGYLTLTTNLGPRSLGQRTVNRDFTLQPTFNLERGSVAAHPVAPPVVVETFPRSGAAEVDPAITELRVTFSKPMRDGSWSWTIWGQETFPEMTGAPRFLSDQRTCVLPVKLQPGKVYATWLNSDSHHDFKDTEDQEAVPYLLIFETRKQPPLATIGKAK
jgi:hypothetical protein